MTPSEKKSLTQINKIDKFQEVFKKLTINKRLTYGEQVYILNIALIFIDFYKRDRRHTSYRELAYYIILKYSLQYDDYKPLYDISLEFGFYPTAKDIIDKELIDIHKITDILVDITLDTYKVENQYIQTFEQFKAQSSLLNSSSNEVAYVAPTSFGKSSIIINLIERYLEQNPKIVIVVPTKSLLMQTYKMIKNESFGTRLLIHDEMYDNDESFIAIFTQERALRFIERKEAFFDLLFIDEAHNLMSNDSRSILLSRLIRKNQLLNSNQKIVYLTPLVKDANKLKIDSVQFIEETKIDFNLKEAEIYEYSLDGTVTQYNRFVNEFYILGEHDNYFNYIIDNANEKNFIYVRQPRKIEKLAKVFIDSFSSIENEPKIDELIKILEKNVHEDFYGIQALKKGVVYLHGKLPDLIKEYLEHKFKKIPQLKYVIANSVILEGVNFPIDTLFILNTYSLDAKDLTNLIGRVNRLDSIFVSNINKLHKLLPQIHFINHQYYNNKNSNMKNQITKLRSKIFEDKIDNPILESFELDKLKEQEREKAESIINDENSILQEATTEEEKLKRSCMNQGIHIYYNDFDRVIEKILKKIESINDNLERWNSIDVLRKISWLFIESINELSDFELQRLKEEKARNYYNRFIERSHRYSLKENIEDTFTYFKKRQDEGDFELYIGQSYGEYAKQTSYPNSGQFEVYINLLFKSDEELINLAIIKLQIEENFVSFHINKFIELLYEYELISEREYNLVVYGTEERKYIEFVKFGLNGNLISRLESDGQLDNLFIDDKTGNIVTNREFDEFKESIDDFYKFEIERFI